MHKHDIPKVLHSFSLSTGLKGSHMVQTSLDKNTQITSGYDPNHKLHLRNYFWFSILKLHANHTLKIQKWQKAEHQGELYPPFMIIKWIPSTSLPVIHRLISCSPFSIRNTQAMLFWDKLTFQLENIQIISGLATHNSPAVLCCWFSSVQEWLIQKGWWLQYPSPSPKHMVLLEYGELFCSMFSWRRNLWPIQPAQISKCY